MLARRIDVAITPTLHREARVAQHRVSCRPHRLSHAGIGNFGRLWGSFRPDHLAPFEPERAARARQSAWALGSTPCLPMTVPSQPVRTCEPFGVGRTFFTAVSSTVPATTERRVIAGVRTVPPRSDELLVAPARQRRFVQRHANGIFGVLARRRDEIIRDTLLATRTASACSSSRNQPNGFDRLAGIKQSDPQIRLQLLSLAIWDKSPPSPPEISVDNDVHVLAVDRLIAFADANARSRIVARDQRNAFDPVLGSGEHPSA